MFNFQNIYSTFDDQSDNLKFNIQKKSSLIKLNIKKYFLLYFWFKFEFTTKKIRIFLQSFPYSFDF